MGLTRTISNFITRGGHFALLIFFGMWIFPTYILPLYGPYEIILSITNYIFAIANLGYTLVILIAPIHYITNNTEPHDLSSPTPMTYIDTTTCPCGHIPMEEDVVHCNISGGCLEGYQYYCEYLGYPVYKENYRVTLIFKGTSAFLAVYQYLLTVSPYMRMMGRVLIGENYVGDNLYLSVLLDKMPYVVLIFNILLFFVTLTVMLVFTDAVYHIYLYKIGKRQYLHCKEKYRKLE